MIAALSQSSCCSGLQCQDWLRVYEDLGSLTGQFINDLFMEGIKTDGNTHPTQGRIKHSQ